MVDMDLALMFHHFRAWAWWLLPFAVILYVALDYLGFEKQRRKGFLDTLGVKDDVGDGSSSSTASKTDQAGASVAS